MSSAGRPGGPVPGDGDSGNDGDDGLAERVAERLARVRERIRSAGGDERRITVVAVTKGFGPAVPRAARKAGLCDLGENYADELLAKSSALEGPAEGDAGELRWHFLGAIQRNKIPRLAPLVALWQGLDRIEEGRAIAARAPGAGVLVEVDTSGLPARGGVPPEEVATLVRDLAGLDLAVRGLMTVAPPDERGAERAFAAVASLADELGLPERSMGMSDDLELAVANGATMVRIGRALFGARR